MPKKMRKFENMRDAMRAISGQTNYDLALDMEITLRHLFGCVQENRIPYKGVINWCIEHDVPLEEILLEQGN